jgi:hypothetical protein
MAFQKEIEIIRRYRDKFLAHLDSDEVMNIPGLAGCGKTQLTEHLCKHRVSGGMTNGQVARCATVEILSATDYQDVLP